LSGTIAEFPAPTVAGHPFGIATGPDGRTWFTEFSGNDIAAATPADIRVLALPSAPTPDVVGVVQGGMVAWTFPAPGIHSATDTSGMGLFDSGPRLPVSYFASRFVAAGTYTYVDTGSSAKGTVKVPLVAKPKKGHPTTKFTITWAAGAAPGDFVFDVQVKRPGSTQFENWQRGVTTLQANFTPDAGKGTYSFRARIRNTANGAASGYSAAKSIKVT